MENINNKNPEDSSFSRANENNAILNADSWEVYRETLDFVDPVTCSGKEYGNKYKTSYDFSPYMYQYQQRDHNFSEKELKDIYNDYIDKIYNENIRPKIRYIINEAINKHNKNNNALNKIDDEIKENNRDYYSEINYDELSESEIENIEQERFKDFCNQTQWDYDLEKKRNLEINKQRQWLEQLYDDQNYCQEAQMTQVGKHYKEVVLPAKREKMAYHKKMLSQIESDCESYNQ